MDGSDHKSVSSSTTIKPSSAPNPKLPASSTDENDQSYGEMVMNLQNSKKPSTTTKMTKHFMSPTTSSASKAIAPRKKILTERNENTDTQFQKSQNVSICDRSDSLSVSDDLSLEAYSPLTNYPSPRPKFLRYKPNGRREIILRYEKEVKERKESADLVSVSKEGEQVEERDEDVEEAEEEEEMGRGGILRRFLEFVLVMLVLVLSTIYISSMNSPTFSPALQALEGLKDGWYLKIHDHVYETMKNFRCEDDHYLKVMEFKEILKLFGGGGLMDGNVGLMKLNQTVFDESFEEAEMVGDVSLVKVEEMSDNLGEMAEVQGTENDVHDHEMEKSVEGSDQMLENFELIGTEEDGEKLENFELIGTEEDGEKLGSFEDNQIPTVPNAFQQESDVVMDPVQEVNNVAAGATEMVKSENIPDNAITNFETQSFEAEPNLKEGLLEQIETDITFKPVIGVTLFSVVIVTLALDLHLKRKRNVGKESKETAPIIRPCGSKYEETEKCSSEIPNVGEECADPFSSPVSLVRNQSNQQGVKESSISLFLSRRPSVELLGEFEVVQMSSSLRSCGVKSRMAESEVNSHSVSFNKEFGNCNKAHSVPLHAHPCVSEFSAMNSLSYGHFTPERKILKKEEGKDAETKKVAVTPMRRSSRISNRAITSP